MKYTPKIENSFWGILFYLRFTSNHKNGEVKALSEACLDRTYFYRYETSSSMEILVWQCLSAVDFSSV